MSGHDTADVDRKCGRGRNFMYFVALTCCFVVELPGIEPDALPGNLPSELRFRYVSVRF
jgi:hypothetical protein